MKGIENCTMTGSSNPSTEQLNWLSEVASAITKGTVDRHSVLSSQNAPNNPHSNTSTTMYLSNSGAIFSQPIGLAKNMDGNSVRMFSPPFRVERTCHIQSASVPVGGNSATLYYTQAPRSTPYSNFFQATFSSPTPFPASSSLIATTTVSPSETRHSYLQADGNPPLVGNQTLSSTHVQLPCSPSYLQQPVAASPAATQTTVVHNRVLTQGRSLLISRSPEAMLLQSNQDTRMHISPNLPQVTEDPTQKKKSFGCTELGTSSLVESTMNPIQDFTLQKESCQQRTSPSQTGYRMPTGKEGSLKHRILRLPSISIVDPPPTVVSDAPLSAPPIRTHREPSPKQTRSIPSSGYRSFSSSASSLTDASNRLPSSNASPTGVFHNRRSSVSSGTPSPAPPSSPNQLKYPQSFMKGAIIQLANNQLKQVENLTTEDFMECGMLSPTLRIDSSTVGSIEKMPCTGSAKLGFSVGQDNIQIIVEAPLEHPFFVYKQGWSSCSPDRSAQRYGLSCHKLKVGDTCISLTEKSQTTNGGPKTSPGNVPHPAMDDNCNLVLDKTAGSIEVKSVSRPTLSSEKQPHCTESESKSKIEGPSEQRRKRRWSAPDNLPQNDDVINC